MCLFCVVLTFLLCVDFSGKFDCFWFVELCRYTCGNGWGWRRGAASGPDMRRTAESLRSGHISPAATQITTPPMLLCVLQWDYCYPELIIKAEWRRDPNLLECWLSARSLSGQACWQSTCWSELICCPALHVSNIYCPNQTKSYIKICHRWSYFCHLQNCIIFFFSTNELMFSTMLVVWLVCQHKNYQTDFHKAWMEDLGILFLTFLKISTLLVDFSGNDSWMLMIKFSYI